MIPVTVCFEEIDESRLSARELIDLKEDGIPKVVCRFSSEDAPEGLAAYMPIPAFIMDDLKDESTCQQRGLIFVYLVCSLLNIESPKLTKLSILGSTDPEDGSIDVAVMLEVLDEKSGKTQSCEIPVTVSLYLLQTFAVPAFIDEHLIQAPTAGGLKAALLSASPSDIGHYVLPTNRT